MPRLHTAGKVVMAVEVQSAINLNEPGATTTATRHIAGDSNHSTSTKLPDSPQTLTGLSGLTIERMAGLDSHRQRRVDWQANYVPTSASDYVRQGPLAIGSNDSHAKVTIQGI